MTQTLAAELRARRLEVQKEVKAREVAVEEQLFAARAKWLTMSLDERVDYFKHWLHTKCKMELQTAIETNTCGIYVWGFLPEGDTDQEDALAGVITPVLTAFAGSFALQASSPSRFIHISEHCPRKRSFSVLDFHLCIREAAECRHFNDHHHMKIDVPSF